ncbi:MULTISPECIES: maleylpyruvate isomerase N-terminal domain-containing protein [Nocardioides]|uniref:Maleylpyruvate isomerase N-terminal domain-containing protein n=1 Tax=Nocardioides vastitatis TaxID=2568655 RepID=A0ABW0ZIN0_9ACTN|nr:maleylpyruvate isomerase N-terminal domain-containing protein [Nocardioides sp.]THJ04342.1 hypothetical protein E7Z54_09020 [Nocardioides sp.]
MELRWEDSRQAFIDGADQFVRTTALVGDRWSEPGLGEWDVRALVGHTSRALLTVEEYLDQPAPAVDVDGPADYFRVVKSVASSEVIAQRGRDAGAALGGSPEVAVAEIAARVLTRLDSCDGTELVTTLVGGMRLSDYLPTRTFELAVHVTDLAVVLGVPTVVPTATAEQALAIVCDLAVAGRVAGPLLLAATGRPVPTTGFTVL